MNITLKEDCHPELIKKLKELFSTVIIDYYNVDEVDLSKDDKFTNFMVAGGICSPDVFFKNNIFKNKKQIKCKITDKIIKSEKIIFLELSFYLSKGNTKNSEVKFIFQVGANGHRLIISESKYWNLRYDVTNSIMHLDEVNYEYTNTELAYYLLYTDNIVEELIENDMNKKDIQSLLFEKFNQDADDIKNLLMIKEMVLF